MPHLRRPEAQIQRAVFQHLRARAYPGVFFFHCPNGGYRTKTEGAILKGLGVVAGVPDVIIIYRARIYALELKAERGRLTPVQRETLAALDAAGARTAVATGLDQALAILEKWQLLRGVITCDSRSNGQPTKIHA